MQRGRQRRSSSASSGLSSGLESAYSPRSGASRASSRRYSLSRTPTPENNDNDNDELDDEDDEGDEAPAQTLTRAEIGGYAALLSGLRTRDGSGLAARLLSGVPRWAYRSPTPEEVDELQSSSAPASPVAPSPSRTPTRDGSATPSLFSPSSASASAAQADTATRWPLHPSELPPAPPLADALADAASRLVHRGALVLPSPPTGPVRSGRRKRKTPTEDVRDELGVAPEVADVVAQRVSMVLDRTLASLAAMQGVTLARDRKVMRWHAVLAAAGMVADQRVVESATARLNAIFKEEERADGELLRHRLDAAQEVQAAHRADRRDTLDSLYAVPPLVAHPGRARKHRKAEDVAAMAAKQEAREAKKQRKSELKDEKRAAREARREAKRLKEKQRLQKYQAK